MDIETKVKVRIDVHIEKLVEIRSLMKATGAAAQVNKIVSNTGKISTKDPPGK